MGGGVLGVADFKVFLALYERVLAGFLADPADRENLHRGPARQFARLRLSRWAG